MTTWQTAVARFQRVVGLAAGDEENDTEDPVEGFVSAIVNGTELSNNNDEGIDQVEEKSGGPPLAIPSHPLFFSDSLDPILLSLVQLSSLPSHHRFPADYLESIGLVVTLNHLIRRSFATIDVLLNAMKKATTPISTTEKRGPKKSASLVELEMLDAKLLSEWRRVATGFRLLGNVVANLPAASFGDAEWIAESISISLCCQYLIAGILTERDTIPFVRGSFQSMGVCERSRFINSTIPPSFVYYDAKR